MAKECGCCKAPRLIFPCSGASDVGRLADLSARTMTKEGFGKMYCLAGIGGRVEDILVNARAASAILAIDGCQQNCAKKTMELAGFKDFAYIQLADMGFEKGKTKVSVDEIRKVSVLGKTKLDSLEGSVIQCEK